MSDNIEVEKAVDVGLSPTEDKYSTRSIHEEPDMFHITKFIKLLNYETTTSSSKIMESLLDNLHHYVSCRLFFAASSTTAPIVSKEEFEKWLLYVTYLLTSTNYSALKSLISHKSKPLSIITRYVKKNIFVDYVKSLFGAPKKSADGLPLEQQEIVAALSNAWTGKELGDVYAKMIGSNKIKDTNGVQNVLKYMEAYKDLLEQFGSYATDSTIKDSVEKLCSNYNKFYKARWFPVKDGAQTQLLVIATAQQHH